MVGPQVIEVVVNDSDIDDTDDANGEPDVTVNGKILRMAQAVDGQWYGYFADRTQAENADSTTNVAGSGLDFGTICAADDGVTVTGVNMDDTVGFALGTVTECTDSASSIINNNNVLREAKELNGNNAANTSNDTNGQISVKANAWPFIQLYNLNPTGNVHIQYNKGGGAQSTVLTFDTVDDYAGLELDRQTYPLGSQVHATITDTWLNIDPTDEDSWTFDTTTGNPYYQVFDENGRSGGTAINIGNDLGDLMCDDNCKLLISLSDQDRTPVLTIQDNDDSAIYGNANNATSFFILNDESNPRDETELGAGTVPVTITESGPNTGVFGTYDESDTSVLAITTMAQRGTSGSIDYNETPRTVLTGFDFATVDISPVDDEWSSGEEIPFILTDGDQNRNSRVDEDLSLSDPAVTLIPALSTGDPFTIGEGDSTLKAAYYAGDMLVAPATVRVDDFSEIARINPNIVADADPNLLVIDLETTAEELRGTINGGTEFNGFNLLNYDIRSLDQSGVRVLLVQNDGEIINENGTLADTVQYLQLHASNSDQDLVILDPLTESVWSETLYLPPLPIIQDITLTSTGGTFLTHNLRVTGVPSGYDFVSAAPDSTLSTANVAASGSEFGGKIIIRFDLPTVSSSTEITGNLDVRYSDGTNNLDVIVPVTFTVNPPSEPINNPSGAAIDANLHPLPEGIAITEILVRIGTNDGVDFLNIPLMHLFGPDITVTTNNPVLTGVDSADIDARIASGNLVLKDINSNNPEFTITYTFGDGSTQAIVVKVNVDAEVTKPIARVDKVRIVTQISDTTAPSTIHQILADLIPFMTPAYAQDSTTMLGHALYNTAALSNDANIGIAFLFNSGEIPAGTTPIAVDFFSFGFTDDGVQSSERIANQIIRIEAEETGDDTSVFEGSLEYVMLNQLNILDSETYTGISPIADDPSFIVIEDLTDEDAPRVSYNDRGADGVDTPVSDQQEAPSHSGVVTLNQDSYKVADTVQVKLEDADLNVDSDLLEIYTVVTDVGDVDNDQVGADVDGDLEDLSFGSLGRLLDITFDDIRWEDTGDGCDAQYDDGLSATAFTLRETGAGTGIFTGDFQIPADWCRSDIAGVETTTGLRH